MTYAIILSGGSGTRFWPLSRKDSPKQFLSLGTKLPLIEETLSRVIRLVPKENIYIASGKAYEPKVRSSIRRFHIPARNCFLEPQGKNTFPAIAYLTEKIHAADRDAVIIVLPSDHLVGKTGKFISILKAAVCSAGSRGFVTLGIPAQRPETGYGYIKINPGAKSLDPRFCFVERFIEKPDLETAKKFLKSKLYYWNAGIFIFRADYLLTEAKRLMPQEYALICKMKNSAGLKRLWPRLKSISIDYAIMEKAGKIALIPAEIGWTDIGSWKAVEEIMKKDKTGNIFKGNVVSLDCRDNLVWADKRLVATLGIKGLVIVDTRDALLICAKEKAQDVKKLVEELKKKRAKQL